MLLGGADSRFLKVLAPDRAATSQGSLLASSEFQSWSRSWKPETAACLGAGFNLIPTANPSEWLKVAHGPGE